MCVLQSLHGCPKSLVECSGCSQHPDSPIEPVFESFLHTWNEENTQFLNMSKMVLGFKGWCLGTFMTFHILGMSSSQLTNSYFSEGWLNHQPVLCFMFSSNVGNQLSPTFSRAQPPFMTRMVRAKLSSRIAGTVGRGLPPFSYVPWSS